MAEETRNRRTRRPRPGKSSKRNTARVPTAHRFAAIEQIQGVRHDFKLADTHTGKSLGSIYSKKVADYIIGNLNKHAAAAASIIET